jgi:urease alpha subunit
MDWFFDEFVYGTALPHYSMGYNLTNGANGPVLDLSVTQANVTDNFKMVVPVYVELNSGKIFRLGSTMVAGNTTKNDRVDLGALGLKEMPKKIYINYYDDILSTN